MPQEKYKRILLKISGEALADTTGKGIDFSGVQNLLTEIKSIYDLGIEIAIVLGGGNFWRFRDFQNAKIPRVASDQIGMIATTMNIMALSNSLNSAGIPTHMYSSFALESIISKYQIFAARTSLQQKKVVLLGGGTGNPFFTTDTTGALRALELEADVLLKATKVDGVYSEDPSKNPKAQKYETLSFAEAIEKKLQVMDQTAFSLCLEQNLPIIVFNGFEAGNLKKIIQGENIGTAINS